MRIGNPLLSLQTYKVIGINSSQGDKNINNGIFKKYVINEFINSNNIYKNEINIKYKNKSQCESNEKIFGEKFVENNKNNIELIINGEKSKLIPKYELNEGENDITIIIKNKLTNLECMFDNCHSLYNINDLKYLNTKDITNFSYLQCFAPVVQIYIYVRWMFIIIRYKTITKLECIKWKDFSIYVL